MFLPQVWRDFFSKRSYQKSFSRGRFLGKIYQKWYIEGLMIRSYQDRGNKMHFPIIYKSINCKSFPQPCCNPRNSRWQSAIAEGFAEANSVFTVITSAKYIFRSKIYIQFTIFRTYSSTKLSFTNKRYHLHALEKCLYVLQEVRSIIYFWQFFHPLSLRSRGNGTSFALRSYIIVSAKFCNVTFLNNFYFVSFFYHLFICRRQRKIRLATLSKSYL